jgi:hypothetical protein
LCQIYTDSGKVQKKSAKSGRPAVAIQPISGSISGGVSGSGCNAIRHRADERQS